MPHLRRRRESSTPRNRRRLIRRIATIGLLGGIAAYRRKRLDAADRAFPGAVTRTS